MNEFSFYHIVNEHAHKCRTVQEVSETIEEIRTPTEIIKKESGLKRIKHRVAKFFGAVIVAVMATMSIVLYALII
jgi:hypothetical protein